MEEERSLRDGAACSLQVEAGVLCNISATWNWLWLTAGDPCTWSAPCEGYLQGVTCFTTGDGDLEGHLMALDLSSSSLYGTFPSSLLQLCYIHTLDLSDNYLEDYLPSGISQLKTLQSLNLEHNSLDGTIPSSWSSLKLLYDLDLSNNYLHGAIPVSFGEMDALFTLDLGSNQLSGLIPDSLGKLTQLATIDLSENQLAGSIPHFSDNLESLLLQHNRFGGQIPSALGECTLLQYIDLSQNEFTGTIPSEIFEVEYLFIAVFATNSLVGTIPPSMQYLSMLTKIDFENNDLTGTIPSLLGAYSQYLYYVDLSGNSLSGSVPTPLGNATMLQFLDLSDNQLSGTLPDWSPTQLMLTGIHLGTNEITGTIPSSLGCLENLQYLCLPRNQLSGTIPTALGELQALVGLDCSSNQLTGAIPSAIGDLEALESLDFSNNLLTGGIPLQLGKLVDLQLMNLKNNELGGTLPPNFFANLSRISTLDMSSNILQGNLSLADFYSSFTFCNLSSNCFEFSSPSMCNGEISRSKPLCSCVATNSCFIDGDCWSNGESSHGCADVCNTSTTQLAWVHSQCVPIWMVLTLLLIAVLLGGIVLSVVILAVVVTRRRRKNKQLELSETQRLLINYDSNGSSRRRVSMTLWEFPLVVSSPTLTLGLGGHNAPIGVPVSETVTIKNVHSRRSYTYALVCGKSDKFELALEPQSGVLKPKEAASIIVTVTFNCTTRAAIRICLEASVFPPSPDTETVYTWLCGNIDSKLSTRLDFDDIQLQLPPIGDGGYGVVYKGTWRSTDVAVKVLKFQEMDEISFAEFKREIQMMEDIRSIYCINFIGAVTTPGKCCIVTEFCEHGSLSSVMRKYNMCYCLKVKMASDAAKGMNYLHTNGIIHRDFKPDNLLVTSLALNSPVNCKITDFGTTRDINEANATNKYTLGIGTVMYHAPEMILPATEGAYNQSCDVFSYAVTLYELYVDEDCYPPTLFKSFYQVSQFIMEGKRRPIPDSCPSDYARLVTDCWQQDPSARPSFKEIESRVQVIMEEARQNLDTNLPVTTLKQPSAGKPKPSLTTN